MRIYNVTIETEIAVVADSPEEAEEIALEEMRDIDEWDASAAPMTYLPGDWDADSIPFGYRDPAAPDRTIAGWLDVVLPFDHVPPPGGNT